MSCSDIQQHLHDYMEQALSEAQRRRIEAHIKSCPQCRSALSDMKTSLSLTQDLEELDPPPFLATRIMSEVRSISEKQSWLNRLFFVPVRIPAGVMAAAIILFAALHIYTVWMLPGQTDAPSLISDNTDIKLPKGILNPDQPRDSGEMLASRAVPGALEHSQPDVQFTMSVAAIDPAAKAVLRRLLEMDSRIINIVTNEGEYRITAEIKAESNQDLLQFLKSIDQDVGGMAGLPSQPRILVSIVLFRQPDTP